VFGVGVYSFNHESLNLSLCMFYPPDLISRVSFPFFYRKRKNCNLLHSLPAKKEGRSAGLDSSKRVAIQPVHGSSSLTGRKVLPPRSSRSVRARASPARNMHGVDPDSAAAFLYSSSVQIRFVHGPLVWCCSSTYCTPLDQSIRTLAGPRMLLAFFLEI
jgi:hypothetical protein